MPRVLAKARITALLQQTVLAIAILALAGESCHALLPNSPRVQRLIEAGLASLETLEPTKAEEKKLGGKCVVGLAFYKAGRKSHPKVQEAVEACEAAAGTMAALDIYSHGLAIVFLAEATPTSHRNLLKSYLDGLKLKQKQHGGWGYANLKTGDTSQTQYAALAMWQAYRAGVRPDEQMAKKLIVWLLDTQGARGEWGYQGALAKEGQPAEQRGVSQTMVAAAGASLMITADMHGLLFEGSLDQASEAFNSSLPPGVKPVVDGQPAANVKAFPKGGVDWRRVATSLTLGEAWMDENLDLRPKRWPCYYLYAVERYQSFREARAGQIDLEPAWYEKGVAWLEDNQKSEGVWNAQCGQTVDTAFAVLFMLRSTQKSLSTSLGEGAMVSGRGLPADLSAARLRRGQVITELDAVGVGDFLSMIDQEQSDRLDALAADPASLLVGDLAEADAVRLEQTLRTGDPKQRLLAAVALGRAGNLDHVPALLYGLTDPDIPVAIAARDGLRFIARRPLGFGMPDNYNDDQRYLALEKWRTWYLGLRPEATIDLGR